MFLSCVGQRKSAPPPPALLILAFGSHCTGNMTSLAKLKFPVAIRLSTGEPWRAGVSGDGAGHACGVFLVLLGEKLEMKGILLLLVSAAAFAALASAQPAGTYVVTYLTAENYCPFNRSVYVTLTRTGAAGGACTGDSETSTFRTCNSTHQVVYSCPTSDCSGVCTSQGTSRGLLFLHSHACKPNVFVGSISLCFESLEASKCDYALGALGRVPVWRAG